MKSTPATTYPYHRSDECSWQPEEAALRLGALVNLSPPSSSSSTRDGHHYDLLPTIVDDSSSNSTKLLTRGRSSSEVRKLRHAYGSNSLNGGDSIDNDDSNDSGCGGSSSLSWSSCIKSKVKDIVKVLSIISPILHAFKDQLKEPLILMLLFSAGISLLLGNQADAISIGMALGIVSLVAAIQEYRSEKGELVNTVIFIFLFQ
jgi:hypothetical protein